MIDQHLIAIGDIHGTNHWENIIKEYAEPQDFIVFVGDYFDSNILPPNEIIRNVERVFRFSADNSNVILLIGNHDYHYMGYDEDRYSGYNHQYASTYRKILEENRHLLHICVTVEWKNARMLLTHAGVSNTFCIDNGIPLSNVPRGLTELWKHKPEAFGFKQGYGDDYGNHPKQSPLWIRPASLIKDNVYGYKQIVGHTQLSNITTITPHKHTDDTVTFIDTGSNEHSFVIT